MTDSSTTAKEVLIDARKRIEDPKHWTKHYAADAKGHMCFPEEPEAVAFCMLGSLRKSYLSGFGDGSGSVEEATVLLRDVTGVEYLAEFNDRATHDEVLAAFDRAIELA